jgi:sulfoxide reductase heme-binding subunit YedZ
VTRRRWLLHGLRALALVPLAALAVRAATDSLGAEPVETLLHETGQWALRLLLASLAITPARRWLGLAALAPLRRSFGLLAVLYAGLHFGIYLVLEVGLAPALLVEDVTERPYVSAGFGALLLLLPLALTSTRGWQRRLGRRWVRLHRLVYPAAALAVLHFLWLVKADLREPLVHAAVLAALLLARLPRPGGRRLATRSPATRGNGRDSV